jgi:hypothetical protein
MADFNDAVEAMAAKALADAQKVNSGFNKEINPLLAKWARSKWAGAIACGFGVALLGIGGIVGAVFF